MSTYQICPLGDHDSNSFLLAWACQCRAMGVVTAGVVTEALRRRLSKQGRAAPNPLRRATPINRAAHVLTTRTHVHTHKHTPRPHAHTQTVHLLHHVTPQETTAALARHEITIEFHMAIGQRPKHELNARSDKSISTYASNHAPPLHACTPTTLANTHAHEPSLPYTLAFTSLQLITNTTPRSHSATPT